MNDDYSNFSTFVFLCLSLREVILFNEISIYGGGSEMNILKPGGWKDTG